MFGLRLNWSCTRCNTEMYDDLSFVRIYKINGKGDFVRRYCSNCKTVHYVNTMNQKVIVDSDEIQVEDAGVCAF